MANTASRPSVTPTDMPVAPMEMPTNLIAGSRSISVERRPPRDAARPTSWARPSLAKRVASAAIVVRETSEAVDELGLRQRPLVAKPGQHPRLHRALGPSCQRMTHGWIFARGRTGS